MVFSDNKLFVLVETFDEFKNLKLSSDEENNTYITYENQAQTFGTPDILWSQIVFVENRRIIYAKGVIWTDRNFSNITSITNEEIDTLWTTYTSH